MLDDDKLAKTARLIKTLGHPVRIQVILTLGRFGRLNVRSIQHQVHLEQATLSIHLTKMSKQSILQRTRVKNEIYYSLCHPMMIDFINELLLP